ncbi:unnamed protein product [Brachionus calyciflorus]|uniref:Uncharacterized protein n=1 Tax=Brachionus calyciflorus TaxID=104777 RepID=A0A814PWM0_9BILA|nr:unnamed protein product [Brachionus calyciflorus]
MSSLKTFSFFLFCLALVSAVKEVDIELAYKLLVQQVVKNNGLIQTRVDDCQISCPAGSRLLQKPNHQFSSNGCGSYNINVDFSVLNMNEFNQCCDVHDFCYETCSETKKRCDSSFDRCLTGYCNKWAIEYNWYSWQKTTCSSVVKLMTLAVENLGCSTYKSSQLNACYCS